MTREELAAQIMLALIRSIPGRADERLYLDSPKIAADLLASDAVLYADRLLAALEPPQTRD